MGDGGITKIISETAKALEESGTKITKAMSTRLHDLGQATRKAAEHFDKAEDDITDRVPVYSIDEHGNLSRIVKNDAGELDHRPVNADDPAISAIFKDGEEGKADTWEAGKNPLTPKPPGLKAVDSDPIDPNNSELARATARTRLAYKDNGTGSNYAAFHYKNGDDEFILVGKSKQFKAHSEQFAGIPFLERPGDEAGLTNLGKHVDAVYSERSPCTQQRTCAEWIPKYFKNPNLTVTHSFAYDSMAERKISKPLLRSYLGGLFDPSGDV